MNKPLGAIMDEARQNIERAVFAEIQGKGIPASLMDMILDGVQSTIRGMKANEYASAMSQNDVEEVQPEVVQEQEVENEQL